MSGDLAAIRDLLWRDLENIAPGLGIPNSHVPPTHLVMILVEHDKAQVVNRLARFVHEILKSVLKHEE